MPHPIKMTHGLSARGGPQIILERPELAKLLGAIAAEWGSIENIIALIFEFVSLAKKESFVHQRSELAQTIFGCLRSFTAQKEMILAVMKLRCSSELCREFEQLMSEVRKRARERNSIVHTEWQICGDYPDDLIKITDETWVRYTKPDLQEILERSTSLRNKINDFSIKISGVSLREVT